MYYLIKSVKYVGIRDWTYYLCKSDKMYRAVEKYYNNSFSFKYIARYCDYIRLSKIITNLRRKYNVEENIAMNVWMTEQQLIELMKSELEKRYKTRRAIEKRLKILFEFMNKPLQKHKVKRIEKPYPVVIDNRYIARHVKNKGERKFFDGYVDYHGIGKIYRSIDMVEYRESFMIMFNDCSIIFPKDESKISLDAIDGIPDYAISELYDYVRILPDEYADIIRKVLLAYEMMNG